MKCKIIKNTRKSVAKLVSVFYDAPPRYRVRRPYVVFTTLHHKQKSCDTFVLSDYNYSV